MKKSWKTSLAGFLGAAAIGMKHIPSLAPYSEIAATASVLLLGICARDNGVTSEQALSK